MTIGQLARTAEPGGDIQCQERLALSWIAIDEREPAGGDAAGPEPGHGLRLGTRDTVEVNQGGHGELACWLEMGSNAA